MLTDDQWRLIRPLIPPPPTRPTRRGRPAYDDRLILDAIFWVRSTGFPWSLLPLHFPSYLSCRRREAEWKKTGVMKAILQALLRDLEERGGFDLAACLQDGTLIFENGGFLIDDKWKDTWQLDTAFIILTPLYKKLLARRNFSPLSHFGRGVGGEGAHNTPHFP